MYKFENKVWGTINGKPGTGLGRDLLHCRKFRERPAISRYTQYCRKIPQGNLQASVCSFKRAVWRGNQKAAIFGLFLKSTRIPTRKMGR